MWCGSWLARLRVSARLQMIFCFRFPINVPRVDVPQFQLFVRQVWVDVHDLESFSSLATLDGSTAGGVEALAADHTDDHTKHGQQGDQDGVTVVGGITNVGGG